MRECMLTTTDNPYDPFDQFDEWYAFDMQKGYNSCQLLDRTCVTSDSFNDDTILHDIEETIDNILKFIGGNYRKVVRET